jgi:hypothetical protein
MEFKKICGWLPMSLWPSAICLFTTMLLRELIAAVLHSAPFILIPGACSVQMYRMAQPTQEN